LAVVFAQPQRRPESPPVDPAWLRYVRPMARVAIWLVPVYALCHLWWSLQERPDPLADPVAWAERVASASYQQSRMLAGFGSLTLGLVAMVVLVALLAGMRGRWTAVAGLLTGLAATAMLLPQVGLWTITAAAIADTVPGAVPAARLYAQMTDDASPVLAIGVSLFTAAWLLLGLAVWRSGVLNRADGILLMMGGLLVGVAELLAPVVVPLGALLLVAAGLGIAWTAGRVTGEATTAPPTVPRGGYAEPQRAAA
jgi:hypothetical protein